MNDWIREGAEEWFADYKRAADCAGSFRETAIASYENAVNELVTIIRSHRPSGEVFTIPPLQWEWFEVEYDSCGYKALPFPDTNYFVYQPWGTAGRLGATWWWCRNRNATHSCPSPKEGKALAEAHWQSYLKQGLEKV